MSDIAIRSEQQLDIPSGTEPATAQLVQWAQAAVAAGQFAEAVCNTSAVPQAYRGKVQEAAAAILAGAEVGLSPMASLRAFDAIQGTPAPKAITLRAIALGLGHKVEVVGEPNDRIATVRGLRKGETDWQVSTWTIERAQQMGLTSKTQWKQQPAAMLVARATAEVCRWIASDAIMGMPYTSEEIRDQGAAVAERPRPARIVSAADFIDQPTAELSDKGEDYYPPTVEEIVADIAAARTQTELDEIKQACRERGMRDQQILDAWAARSAQLAEAA